MWNLLGIPPSKYTKKEVFKELVYPPQRCPVNILEVEYIPQMVGEEVLSDKY